MSKIVKAINVMVSNPNLVTNVIKGANSTECFFLYDRKHSWSILKRHDGHYRLAYYPGKPDLEQLASIPDEQWDTFDVTEVTYTSADLATKEATESMSDLYSLVNEKVYGMDDVLDDIIDSDSIPF
ncbi:MAG: hypothetical protein P8X79_23015 [Reinekea sp.]